MLKDESMQPTTLVCWCFFAALTSVGMHSKYCAAQETPDEAKQAKVSDGGSGLISAIPLGQVQLLEHQLQVGEPDRLADVSRKLIKIAEQRAHSGDMAESVRLAHNLFLSSSPAEVRNHAFDILLKHAPALLQPHTRKIELHVPNVSCYGRFLDSLKAHVVNRQTWIYRVSIKDTRRVANNQEIQIGTLAELTFWVDQSKSPRALLEEIRSSERYDLQHWSVMAEVAAMEILQSTDSGTE